MSEKQDRRVVKDAEYVLDLLFEKYADASSYDKWLLKPAIKKASEELLVARLALFKNGVLTTQEDINTLSEIKNEIDKAENSQALIMSALKLAAFLGIFA